MPTFKKCGIFYIITYIQRIFTKKKIQKVYLGADNA